MTRLTAAASEPQDPPDLGTGEEGERRRRVLLVDDSATMRATLRILLSELDIELLEASDGLVALQTIRSTTVDLVVCDLRMPGLDGGKLIHLVEQRERAPRFIVISGFGGADAEAVKARRSVVHWLRKPFEPDQLLGVVRDVLASPR